MVDQRSIEMLAFNFASRTFAYRRLAQGLSRVLSAFPSFMREYLDKVIKADQCAQYVDDIGIAANDAEQLINNLRATFQCIQKAGLKLTMPFWRNGNRLTGTYHHSRWSEAAETSGPKFPRNYKIPEVQESTTALLGIFELLPKLHPKTIRKTNAVFQTAH